MPTHKDNPISVILAIDAAWTVKQPSGVALVKSSGTGWCCCKGVAPSYKAFIDLAAGITVDWTTGRFHGDAPNAVLLLEAASSLAGAPVDIVTIDMPVSTVAIEGRRTAERSISKEFGGRGCSAHTPSSKCPGFLGSDLSKQFSNLGYSIATASDQPGTSKRLIEVYPHPALLTLLNRDYRIPYKTGNTTRYWPDSSREERISNLLTEFKAVLKALAVNIDHTAFALPNPDIVKTITSLKRYEDAIDALVCAWVGICYAKGRATAYGDSTAAIWCPKDVK